jgi:hypothetical protein
VILDAAARTDIDAPQPVLLKFAKQHAHGAAL